MSQNKDKEAEQRGAGPSSAKTNALEERDFALSERDSAKAKQKKAEDARDKALEKQQIAESANASLRADRKKKNQFVVTLTHDLRNPIGIIKSAVDAIEAGLNVEDMLSLISKAADTAEELINHLLDANLIKSGKKLPISPREVRLKSVVDDCIKDFSAEDVKRIDITDIDQDLLGFWDEFAIRRALKNLISNAIKYSNADSKITISASSEGKVVKIAVHNFGPVIPLADHAKVFEGYFRSDSAKHLKQLGWGLGLTLVKGIAESHHGMVCLESNEEQGTTFTIQVPRHDPTLAPNNKHEASQSPERS